MNRTLEIVQGAVVLANAKLEPPVQWGQPERYNGGSIRVYLKREGERFSGCFICSRRLKAMTMTWHDTEGAFVRCRGDASVDFVLAQLMGVQNPDEVKS